MRVLVGYDLTVVDSYWLDTSAVGVRNKAVPIQHLQAQDFSVHQPILSK